MSGKFLHPILLVCSLLLFQCHDDTGCFWQDDGVITIAVYSDDGASEACVTAAVQMFRWMGHTVITIGASEVNCGDLGPVDIIYFPGGSTRPYQEEISHYGRAHIRQLVNSGVGFIGTCAGALFASESYEWSVYESSEWLLGIFPGTSTGPIDEIFPQGQWGMCQVNFSEPHSINASEPGPAWIMYYAGPYFTINKGAKVGVIGNYEITGQSAMVACEYGQGRVFLTGPHPEWEEDSDRDSVSYFDGFDDQGSDWDLMRNATRWCLREIE